MKLLLLYALFLVTIFYNPKPISAEQGKLPAIVRLHDSTTGTFFCSGTVISPHIILTAAHCVAVTPLLGPLIISIRSNDGQDLGVEAVVLGADNRGDVALLGGDFAAFNTMRYSVEPTQIINSFKGSKIMACGFPKAGKLWCSDFKFHSLENFQMKGEGFLYPGMSGGPVIDVYNGIVIGVNTAVSSNFILLSPIVEIFAALGVPEPN